MGQVRTDQHDWHFSGSRMLAAAADQQFNAENPITRVNVFEGGEEEREIIERERTLPAPAKAVEELLEVAYRASLLSEEGNFTRTKLVVHPSIPAFHPRPSWIRAAPEPDAIRFEDPPRVDDVWLAKNCAAAERADLRIDCEFRSGAWHASGFTALRFDSIAHQHDGHAAPVAVEVDRPGVVKLYAAADGWHDLVVYSGGRYLRSRKDWMEQLIPDQVIRAVEQQARLQLGESHPLLVRLNESPRKLTDAIARTGVSWHLRRVAESLASARSGGSILWTPSHGQGIASPGTQVSVGTSTPLVDSILARWITSLQWSLRNELSERERDAFRTTAEDLESSDLSNRLQGQQSLLSGLASVDGAVVLTDVMSPHSYRVKLKQQKLADDPVHPGFLKDRGTRHRSAYGFVQSVPGSLGVVVSSDGEVNAMGWLPSGGGMQLNPLLGDN